MQLHWRCINDLFGYCKTEPDGAKNATVEEREALVNEIKTMVKINTGWGATCSKSPKTCRKYASYLELVPEGVAPDSAMRTTIIADTETQADKVKQGELV